MTGFSSMRGGRPRKFKAEINVVPYIDVMMVLLVIFMVSAPMVNPNVINLPTAAKSVAPPTEYIEIALKANGDSSVRINGKKTGGSQAETVEKNKLKAKLQSLHDDNPDMPVMISAEKDIKYDEVIQVISEAKIMGINRVGLATK
ncbi:ExbD/TolR family protein [Glaciimonas sp. Gout2]|uniref:ExbD/TolR family protein n=2 Tax=Glaciimonas TaxID=1229970 RepID=UPI002AB3508F|nr:MULTISPECIES: ExbD/TolR family protein [unclassified Glaciimonas]MDY7547326.1 ExbD/TolR family protein [Glaciimonas sp. CA11.2]MEB0012642.1 ExbD/TolR family protein [Glaciimonas sp. Cout2]MEB0083017.1 ExbD/TolR family protein [Glaciimonas sp. Gout2]